MKRRSVGTVDVADALTISLRIRTHDDEWAGWTPTKVGLTYRQRPAMSNDLAVQCHRLLSISLERNLSRGVAKASRAREFV